MINGLEQWKLSKELTLHQAALLIVGADPADYYGISLIRLRRRNDDTALPKEYHPVLQALVTDVANKELPAKIVTNRNNTIDVENTTVKRSDLRNWVPAKRLKTRFLFEDLHVENYLDPAHPAYSAKLSAAIKSWQAVSSNPKLTKGKSPKQAIEKWLFANATELRLTLNNGEINKTGIEEICKVVNWKPSGGAPKTPTKDKK